MSTSSSAALFKGSPTISVKDNRGLAVRTVQYNRTTVTDKLDCLITRSTYNAIGQLKSSSDPRLFEKGIDNISQINNLSGQALHIDSVDQAWNLVLTDIEGVPHKEWEEGGVARRYEYNKEFHRPTAAYDIKNGLEQVTNRFIYGTTSDVGMNLNTQVIRHYDNAGLLVIDSICLTGQVLTQSRQLLSSSISLSDWQGTIETKWQSKLEPTVYTTNCSYDALGGLLTQVDANKNQQRHEYDVAGLLKASYLKLKGEQTEHVIVHGLEFYANGQKAKEIAGNGVKTFYTYDPMDQRLLSVTTTRPEKDNRNTQLQDLRYSYDPVGNIMSINDAMQTTRFYKNQKVSAEKTYQYDTLYQLIQATGRENDNDNDNDNNQYINYRRTYSYDRGGNLEQLQHTGGSSFTNTFVVSDKTNRLVQQKDSSFIQPDQVDDYFDSHGNLLNLEDGKKLTWGRLDQLKTVAITSQKQEHYQYSEQGKRIRKTQQGIISNIR